MLNGLKTKIKETLFGDADVIANERLVIRACMIGPKGVGKTSVLSAMYGQTKAATSETALFLNATGTTQPKLSNNTYLLQDIFSGSHRAGEEMKKSGIAASDAESSFMFTYGLHNEKVNIDLEIRDYPGEYLVDEPDIVANYIHNSDALLIAIDTPCLMENNGVYNDGMNCPQTVIEFFHNNLDCSEEKLILFVPLKCEKYYYEKKLDLVTERIEDVYKEMITGIKQKSKYIDANGKPRINVCCAVTPILTLGDVVFSSFGNSGGIDTHNNFRGNPIPNEMHYVYRPAAKYAPKYCEQPLCYLLSFMSKKYNEIRKTASDKGWINKLKKIFALIPNFENIEMEMAKLGNKRIESGNGFKILFGAGRIR